MKEEPENREKTAIIIDHRARNIGGGPSWRERVTIPFWRYEGKIPIEWMVGPSIGVYVSSPNSSNPSLSENKPDFLREFSRVVCPLYFPVSDHLSLTLLCSTVLEEWLCDWTLEPQETALKFLSTVVSCLLCQWLLPLRNGRMVIPG